MNRTSNQIPVACSLAGPELRQREATLLAQFRSAVVATEELPDGYAFRVPGDKKWIALVGELIVAERECCPFLKFEFVAEPNKGPVIVRVTGPEGAKAFLKTTLCKTERST